jgi:hypothetical protein
VGLVRFELTTSSMPLRNINHLQAFLPETKDLVAADLDASGRHGATLGRLDSTRLQDSTPGTGTRRALARGCKLF